MRRPRHSLPLPPAYHDEDAYVADLLRFVTRSDLLRLLTGGVHILDFFTREPDLYGWLLPAEWRAWCGAQSLQQVVDLVLRVELDGVAEGHNQESTKKDETFNQLGYSSAPPQSLIDYVHGVRRLLLERSFMPRAHGGRGYAHGRGKQAASGKADLESGFTRQVAVGMKEKKVHEVFHFSRYLDELAASIPVGDSPEEDNKSSSASLAQVRSAITHLVDFGSGQNYLGRALASEPLNRNVIAVEGRPHNIEGAKKMDITARLAQRVGILRNKKAYREEMKRATDGILPATASLSLDESHAAEGSPDAKITDGMASDQDGSQNELGPHDVRTTMELSSGRVIQARIEPVPLGRGTVQHVEHKLADGDLSKVVSEIIEPQDTSDQGLAALEHVKSQSGEANGDAADRTIILDCARKAEPNLMVIGLHSCGNLTHHGLKSLVLNPEVSAVAIVGCCYNLTTERLTPPTYKMPGLEPQPQANSVGGPFPSGDPEGFPMSERFCSLAWPDGRKGIHFNITSRMMAVQAPQNWGPVDSEEFFTRHFYRALLQKMFLDTGIVEKPANHDVMVRGYNLGGRSAAGYNTGGATQPIIIGSLRKSCYSNFVSYVRGALAKLIKDTDKGALYQEKLGSLSDEDIAKYEEEYLPRKKELSIVWTLMAYSAGLVEAVIVADRWQWLREQPAVRESWVEPVFDYARSPRNLVVVGIK